MPNRALVKFGSIDAAREIQGELCALLELIKGSLDKIWMVEESSIDGGEEEGVRYGPEATTADIIENREKERRYLPPYNLLGERVQLDLLSFPVCCTASSCRRIAQGCLPRTLHEFPFNFQSPTFDARPLPITTGIGDWRYFLEVNVQL